jgi:centromeric protein E
MGDAVEEKDAEEEISVRVYVRIRPLNKRELGENQTIGWNFNKTSMLEDTPNGQRVYAYDACFGPEGSNAECYDLVGKPVVLKAMAGFNGTVFTYGQTGSGKTWTMRGSDSDPGMMILCIRDIFDYIDAHKDKEYQLKVSYLEVYNEEINDLLSIGENSRNLKITAEDAVRGAVIGNLVEEEVKTPDEFMEVLFKGEANRSYASTSMNDNSSRSHVIYRVTILIKDIMDGPDDGLDENGFIRKDDGAFSGAVSYMNLVDLAGSERQKSTNATGKTLKEGANINKSLLALGAVINKLGQKGKKGKDAFIPYRDSKLTRILKQSLGGNTITSILCAVTPAPMHREETVSTLKFGQLCKLIKNNVASNVVVDDKVLMRQYRATIAELKEQLEVANSNAMGGAMAAAERAAYEDRMRQLEDLVVTNGGDFDSVPQVELPKAVSVTTSGGGGGGGGSVSDDEYREMRGKMQDMQRRIATLTAQAKEVSDVQELKASVEEYELQCRAEIEEDAAKLEADKHAFSVERIQILTDRTGLDEKEGKVGQLLATLDERESKLRHLLGTLREQQEQWQRAVSDLQRREDLVEEWQRTCSVTLLFFLSFCLFVVSLSLSYPSMAPCLHDVSDTT